MDEDLCIHDMWIRSCHLCQAPPPGVNASGFTTRGGHAFHNDRDCEWLRRGQRRADRAGLQLHHGRALPALLRTQPAGYSVMS
jgi:hypothetical protein